MCTAVRLCFCGRGGFILWRVVRAGPCERSLSQAAREGKALLLHYGRRQAC
jgi:hypothetical protein